MNPNEIGYALRQQQQQVEAIRSAVERLTAADGVLQNYKTTITRLTDEHKALQDLLKTSLRERDEFKNLLGNTQQAVRDLQARFDLDKNAAVRPRSIDDIPGVRTPQWYTVEVNFTSGETVTKFGTAEIAPEGPFIITQINPVYQSLDTATSPADLTPLLGRMLPVSATAMFYNQTGNDDGTNPNTPLAVASIAELIPELTFQIEIQGSGRFWTNQKVPGAFFYGNSNPLYTGIMGWIDYSDRIKVQVTPERAIPLTGKVLFGFHGYQILNPVKLTQMLGFA